MMRPRTFASLFAGSEELEEAARLVGWIAINHAAVEQALDYLLWQLEAFEQAARLSFKEMDRPRQWEKLRGLRVQKPGRKIAHEVESITKLLRKQKILARLNESKATERILAEWKRLSDVAESLSRQRGEVIHSAVAWSGKLVRTTGSALDSNTLPLDLERDEKLREELGKLTSDLGIFTTDLGSLLPFPGPDRIITTRVELQLPGKEPPAGSRRES